MTQLMTHASNLTVLQNEFLPAMTSSSLFPSMLTPTPMMLASLPVNPTDADAKMEPDSDGDSPTGGLEGSSSS